MAKHLRKEIENLKKKLLYLSAAVEEALKKAVWAIHDRDERLAEKVIEGDGEIDEMEVELEEDCLKILALHQPVAIDLRFIVAVLKINSDLERIGDLAANIAERAVFLSRKETVEFDFDLKKMASDVQAMLQKSLDSIVNFDSDEARQVCARDEKIDEAHRRFFKIIIDSFSEHPEKIESIIPFISISKYLERIADHTTNIAEDVIYMLEGDIVRHKVEQL